MIYTKMTKKAMLICFEAHKDQKDKTGMPYVFHSFHIAEQMTDEVTTIVALLHDVVEDTQITFANLMHEGFDEEIISALRLLTRDLSEPYMEYIRKIKSNPIATTVKLADLAHNSDLTRFSHPTAFDLQRNEKYLEAIRLLQS